MKKKPEEKCSEKINMGDDPDRAYVRALKLANKHQKSYYGYWCPHCDRIHLTTRDEPKSGHNPFIFKTTPDSEYQFQGW
jgi:hypothetical protein